MDKRVYWVDGLGRNHILVHDCGHIVQVGDTFEVVPIEDIRFTHVNEGLKVTVLGPHPQRSRYEEGNLMGEPEHDAHPDWGQIHDDFPPEWLGCSWVEVPNE